MRSGYRGEGDRKGTERNTTVVPVVKVEGGAVKVYDAVRGSYLRTLTAGAVNAVASGTFVTVTMQNGKTNVYDALSGSYLRSL